MLAFWLTCLLEAPWWLWCLFGERSARPERPRRRRRTVLLALGLTLVLNLLTHPVVWRVTNADPTWRTWAWAELAAVLVEVLVAALVLSKSGVREPWVTALLYAVGANAGSALVGLVFF
ncbi:hypothetical protein [Enemella sp. A6]|uniref:hypothetical protein n=1 Tax=Enemella sp. A6 TaxID=3440152 RepID=UPI003EBC2154